MQKLTNVSLKNYSSFHSGGIAETLFVCESSDEVASAVSEYRSDIKTILGFGTNVLISDQGLDGITIVTKNGGFVFEDDIVIADTGVWWDDVVQKSIDLNLWGIELMSGIPSSIGGAISGNIAAYGQQVADTLLWVDVIAIDSQKIKRIPAEQLSFDYRYCSVGSDKNLIILKAAFRLSRSQTKPLEYGSALRIAKEHSLDANRLTDRRLIILEARRRGGSLYNPDDSQKSFTAGSFFKNPIVPLEIAKKVTAYDETGKSEDQLLKQNKIHGGSDHRVSAAHVLLASGFKRGQTWGNVRLHPDHILKIENTGEATSQEIYNVSQNIISTVNTKLGIKLEPEVRLIGEFL